MKGMAQMDNNFEISLSPERFGIMQCSDYNVYVSLLKVPEGVNVFKWRVESGSDKEK